MTQIWHSSEMVFLQEALRPCWSRNPVSNICIAFVQRKCQISQNSDVVHVGQPHDRLKRKNLYSCILGFRAHAWLNPWGSTLANSTFPQNSFSSRSLRCGYWRVLIYGSFVTDHEGQHLDVMGWTGLPQNICWNTELQHCACDLVWE